MLTEKHISRWESTGDIKITDGDNDNSSWGFLPPLMLDGIGITLFHMKSFRDNLSSHKKGSSIFFTSKLRLFMSLVDVKCAEDLTKLEKKLKSSHTWESMVKSSYKNQTICSSNLLVGSVESIKMSCKVSNGGKMEKSGWIRLIYYVDY